MGCREVLLGGVSWGGGVERCRVLWGAMGCHEVCGVVGWSVKGCGGVSRGVVGRDGVEGVAEV